MLRNPTIEEDISNIINDEGNSSLAKNLIIKLEKHGFIFRFSAENSNIACYILQNKRQPWETFEDIYGINIKYIINLLENPNTEKISLTSSLKNRYSHSKPTDIELSLDVLSILLSMTYGYFKSKDDIKRRAVPAAGGLYPLDIYLSIPTDNGLESFLYDPSASSLSRVSICKGSIRGLCNGQEIVEHSKGLVTYVYKASMNTKKYGFLGFQFALIESGHAAQNLLLGAAGLGVGSRCIGAINLKNANLAFNLESGQIPLYAVALY